MVPGGQAGFPCSPSAVLAAVTADDVTAASGAGDRPRLPGQEAICGARGGQHGLSKRELRARAEKIAEGNWASQAIRKAIEETMAAVLTATTAATIATTASAG